MKPIPAATEPYLFQALIFGLCALVVAIFTTRAAIFWLRRAGIMDEPNKRSSHTIPTPRGGGIGILPIILGFWLMTWVGAAFDFERQASLAVVGYGIILCAISWLDDQGKVDVPPLIRLIMQVVAVVAPVMMLPDHQTVFQGLVPLWLDRGLTMFGWLWFVNLFNFMDGINGITGTQSAMLATGLALLAGFDTGDVPVMLTASVIAGASLGFLVWNWGAKAHVFLGDVGSIGLGYALGWLMLLTALDGYLVPVIVIPLYHLADATITIVKRLLRGERIWEPHRKHFFQMATREGGLSHPQTVRRIIALNLCLLAIAFIPTMGFVTPLIFRLMLAAGLTGLLLFHFYEIGDDAEQAEKDDKKAAKSSGKSAKKNGRSKMHARRQKRYGLLFTWRRLKRHMTKVT